MYFIYVDESGKPNYNEKGDFILSAIIVRENNWYKISTEVNNLKRYYLSNNADRQEFHTYEIFSGTKAFRKFPILERAGMLTDLVKIIIDNNIRIISVIFEKHRCMKRPDINEWSYRLLLERICMFLKDINYKNYEKQLPLDYGLLMIDSVERKFDMKIRRHILDFYENGSYYQSNNYLIEDPIFIKSHFRNLSQLADVVAFITQRYYDMLKDKSAPHRRSKPGHPLETTVNALFKKLSDMSYHRGRKGIMGYGIKKFP